ncbi:anoctamin-9-like isoform X1 [Tachypleus tridentatus]|uniref:anoctamin-9-like isoform X1 n=1 Tax=Tachypleus tridentatus TaxID=6853 RepID=UPI003FD26447
MNNWASFSTIYKKKPLDDINKDICEDYKDAILCPWCDVEGYRYGRLGQTFTFAKITHLFDNVAAVFLAVFMSLWGTSKARIFSSVINSKEKETLLQG